MRGAAVLLASITALHAAERRTSDAPPGKVFVYKQSGGKPQTLEVYFPKEWDPAKKVPGVLLFHGGGWTGGNLDQFRYACNYLASRGLVAATANYRMLAKKDIAGLPEGQSHKRACVTDAKSAIRWMKQHAEELGIDPERLITGGGSAGGHIAVLATTNPGLNDPNDPDGIDTSVVAYLLFNPAFSASDVGDPEVDALKHLAADLPPAVVFFGTADGWKRGWDAVEQRLKKFDARMPAVWLAEGQPHGFFNRPPWRDVTLAAADRFLVEQGFLHGRPTLAPPATGEALVPGRIASE
jgi:acetyl esterase/lipase